MDSHPLPPGPSVLLENAIFDNERSPLSPPTSSISGDQSSGSTTPSQASENSLKADPLSMSSTTTIVTETQDGKGLPQTTTQTIEHVGAETVSATFSADGSFSATPLPPVKGSRVKTRRTHTFKPRLSRFDRDHPESSQDPFRGFWSLAWILMFVAAVRTSLHHYEQVGAIWGTEFFHLISEDAMNLALSDMVMVSATLLCVPFAKLLQHGWLRYYWTGAILQHIFQTSFLALAISWTFHRQWPWVQSGFLTLHSISMLMKIHSYCSWNGELSEKKIQLTQLSDELDALLASSGGRTKAEAVAREARAKQKKATDGNRRASPSPVREGLVRRRGSLTRRSSSTSTNIPPTVRERELAFDDDISLLTCHPDPKISIKAEQVESVRETLVSTGLNKVQWPNNITVLNFLDYLLVPTLVYELEYPRTDKIRPLYILEKTLATFGTFSLIILIVEHYILPVSVNDKSFAVAALDLAIPFMINYLLIFFIIFECICNGFAELTRFSDREFYQDWWNSASFDEFSRKWNIPVHAFLLRHVYTSTITTYRFSKFKAAFVTFLLSACVHELVMLVVTQKIRLYLFALQMGQLPLIVVGRLPLFRKYPALGNLFFWIGLLSGFPILATAYLRY